MKPIQRTRKGYVNIIDGLVALAFFSIIFATLIATYEPASVKTSRTSFKEIHYVSEDVIDVLNKQGVLDEVGTEWAAACNSTTCNTSSPSWEAAKNISESYLDKLISNKYGYKLMIDELDIYNSETNASSGRPIQNNSQSTTYSSRLLVGYGKGLPTMGQVARAFLTTIKEKTTSSYAYFGGFEGQGSLIKYVSLPQGVNTVQQICLEYESGDEFNLKIDNSPVSAVFSKTSPSMSATNRCFNNIDCGGSKCISDNQPGPHKFELTFIGSRAEYHYIAGGFIQIVYNTSEMDTSPETGTGSYDFPGVNGLINLYSSFYVPGILNNMTLHARFRNNYTTYLKIGKVMVLNTSDDANMKFCKTPYGNINGNDYTCNIPNSNLSDLLSGYVSSMSEENIPLRMGVENITGIVGSTEPADVVLITDLSDTMRWQVGLDADGTAINDCSNPSINNSGTSRISLAKCLDKEFIKRILNISGSRVGLVGYTSTANVKNISLTNDTTKLTGEVDTYTYSATPGRCVCCAINKALQMLNSTEIIPNGNNSWRYIAYDSKCLNSCDPTTTPDPQCTPGDIGGKNWTNTSAEKSKNWDWVDLPQDGVPPLSNNWVVIYYRKTFTWPQPLTSDPILYVRSKSGVECYLNGNRVGNDSTCGTATDWNQAWNVPMSFFRPAGSLNILTCRVRTKSQPFEGTDFNVKLTSSSSPNKKYIVVMSDGGADYYCGGCGSPPGCGTCSEVNGISDPGCSGNCIGGQCQQSINDAECAAKRAGDSGITVHSIGFGPGFGSVPCNNAIDMLTAIASYGKGEYEGSQDPTELWDIYMGNARNLVNIIYTSQTINVMGNMIPSILYPESQINFLYTPVINYSSYGEISLTQDTGIFNDVVNCIGRIFVPKVVKVSDVKVTSYSGYHWTDYLTVNNSLPINIDNPVYTLRDNKTGDNYIFIGDPYIVQIPPSRIELGQNNSVNISTGDGPTPPYTGCSKDDRAIYTVRLTGRVGYGDAFFTNYGCNWTIEFEDGTNITEMMPTTYSGNHSCFYTATNLSYDLNDAVDDAVYRLMQSLDSNGNHKIEVKLDSSMIQIDFSESGGVQSLWGPINVKLVVWDKKG